MKNTNKKQKSQSATALPRLHVFFSRDDVEVESKCDNNTTWGLLWNRTRDRRQTIVLVGLLSSKNDQKLTDYRKTLDRLKLKAKGTDSARLTDELEIVEINGGQQDRDDPWWLQLFGDKKIRDADQYQWVKFGTDSKGRRTNYQFPTKNVESDTEWSRILDVLNHCDSIEEIIQSGSVPDAIPEDAVKPTHIHSTSDGNDQVETDDSENSRSLFLGPLSSSMTILHLQNLHSLQLSSIAIVRCAQAFYALWNNTIPGTTNKALQTNTRFLSSPIDLSKEKVSRWNAFLSALFDMLLGLGIGAVLVHLLLHPKLLEKMLHGNLTLKQNAFSYLQDNIAWLETFPAGFKLNEQLTHTMGRGIRGLLNRHKMFLLTTLWNPDVGSHFLVPALAAMATLGGWTTFLAIVLDLWRLEIVHATLLAVCFRKLYQMELFLLSALFRLFRGKKRNVLRQRTDSMKYDAMQLLVGTIAFCVCVFLWTTVMVYYTFFLICNLAMHLPLMVCSIVYATSRSIPFGSLLFRFSKPHWFPNDVFLKDLDPSAFLQVTELVLILESPASILAKPTSGPLKGLLSWYLVSVLEILYPRSSHQSHSFLPPALLVVNNAKE